MKKFRMITMCLFAMMATSLRVKAQEVTITLFPGWNWISYPNSAVMSVNDALGTFTPMNGDKIKGQFSNSSYLNGYWRGGVTHFIPGWGYMYYSARTEVVEFVFANAETSDVVVTTSEPTDITATSAVVSSTVTIGEGNHIFVRGVCWGTESNPTIDDSYQAGDNVAGSQSFTLNNLTPSTTYYVRAYMVSDYGLAYGEEQNFTTLDSGNGNDHDYVDLGLPSGTLWATCNVGADAPEDYGDYFAWGETVPKDYYDWSTYQYSNGGFYDEYGFHPYLTKYCNNSEYGYNGYTDNLTILLLEDDAATANWGSDWRMPTKEEFQELYNNTTVTWTTQNGVNGGLFTASNDNSLFLPAAGFRSSSGLNYAGSHGYYWSSSLYTDSPKFARYFGVYSDSSYGMGNSNGGRNCGRPVRAVRSGTTNYSITVSSIPTFGGTVTGGGTYQQGQSCTVIATANSNYTFMNWTENNEVVSTNASYTFTVSGNRTLVANFTYNGGGSDHDYVDLGLPSGTMWATCNVGANSPEDYGDYFAWGETQPKNNYYWNTYQYCNGGDGWNTLTKYCSNFSYGYNGFTDNLTYLQPGDDVATVNWGENWRMPTKIEWQELYNNTTCTWATQNGVNGRLFTASNGNSLFIPAAGYGDSNGPNAIGNMGDYWSRTLNPSFPYYAYGFYFDSGGFTVYDSYRDGGLCVRPVRAQQGAINGLFSVSDTRQVYFSQGNLQYQASTNTWRFAENQWDYVGTHTPENNEPIGGTVNGSDNHNISSTYNGWIDLFGWGTSGYHDSSDPYNVNYQPWSTSWSTVNENYNYFGYGPSTNMSSPNLTGSSANYDWGVYNPISNGGNNSNQWRTLTQSEWNYIFFDRATVSGIRYAKAKVNNVNGVILLPDNWSNSIYSLSDTNTEDASFNSNILTISEWTIIEDAGAVFLPAASTRSGTWIYNVGSVGNYWSTSYCNSDGACIVYFNAYCIIIDINACGGRFGGDSVRLVRDAE